MVRTNTRVSSERSSKAKRSWRRVDHHGKVKTIRPSYVNLPKEHPPSIPPFHVYSLQEYPVGWTDALRKSIRRRDKQCMLCYTRKKRLDVHHINYQKIDCTPWNLITLCKDCHKSTNANRQYWYPHLFKLIRLTYKQNQSLRPTEVDGMVRI